MSFSTSLGTALFSKNDCLNEGTRWDLNYQFLITNVNQSNLNFCAIISLMKQLWLVPSLHDIKFVCRVLHDC